MNVTTKENNRKRLEAMEDRLMLRLKTLDAKGKDGLNIALDHPTNATGILWTCTKTQANHLLFFHVIFSLQDELHIDLTSQGRLYNEMFNLKSLVRLVEPHVSLFFLSKTQISTF